MGIVEELQGLNAGVPGVVGGREVDRYGPREGSSVDVDGEAPVIRHFNAPGNITRAHAVTRAGDLAGSDINYAARGIPVEDRAVTVVVALK